MIPKVYTMELSREFTEEKIEEDPDFVNLPRFHYSLREVLERYPGGAPERLIAKGVRLTVEEVRSLVDTHGHRLPGAATDLGKKHP